MPQGIRVIMLGRQGAGKGTQCKRLAAHFGVPHISTGEMLRAAIRQETVVGRAVKDVLDRARPDTSWMDSRARQDRLRPSTTSRRCAR
jgi:adenylate kinase